MKKVLKVLSAAMLSAVVAVSAAATVSAAGINAAEQKVLDALNQTATMAGVEKSLPAEYKTQAENYFNTVELTDAQAEAIIAEINKAIGLLEASGAARAAEVTDAQFNEIVAVAKAAAEAGGATIEVTRRADGFANVVLVTKPGSNGGNGGNGGKTPIVDPNGKDGVIKTTGFDVPSVTAVAGVGILMVSAAGIYLFKTSKKESVDA